MTVLRSLLGREQVQLGYQIDLWNNSPHHSFHFLLDQVLEAQEDFPSCTHPAWGSVTSLKTKEGMSLGPQKPNQHSHLVLSGLGLSLFLPILICKASSPVVDLDFKNVTCPPVQMHNSV